MLVEQKKKEKRKKAQEEEEANAAKAKKKKKGKDPLDLKRQLAHKEDELYDPDSTHDAQSPSKKKDKKAEEAKK